MRIRKIYHGLANSETLNESLWVSGLISSHFVLILPRICLLLPRKCSFHVRAGSFVLSVSSRCYLLKLFVQCCKWVALVLCIVGFLPWPWQNPFKQWFLPTSFQPVWWAFGFCKGCIYPNTTLKIPSPKPPMSSSGYLKSVSHIGCLLSDKALNN